jgi:integrase
MLEWYLTAISYDEDIIRHLPWYLTQDDRRRFFAFIDSLRDRPLFAVIYHLGLHVDEAATLTVEELTLKKHPLFPVGDYFADYEVW